MRIYMRLSYQTGLSMLEIIVSLLLLTISITGYLHIHVLSMNMQQLAQQEYLTHLTHKNEQQ